ncbi:sigma-54 interaction domain-containing protein [Sporomusa sphaeroides]|uniref:Arginine utilization regulatory protein RocR n=1 Tax=Sporomusa sphaeroides DSM 2875 TaxID=1337886 RepID=A0ABM9W307_9FIRM|nr:sigma 54-interacting transcriptional regulator [Sporomusa sphaeroides]OLS55106.1 arginine utilization regulatory protein RocR [Sporomusa sphaeroides DSM 2875]CVK19552.1 Arginine utilization regulatory protein RocR [Sporomusa sphaeroides DSM 2875]
MEKKDVVRLEELERENQLLRNIIDKIHEYVLAIDEKDNIVLYNPVAEKIEKLDRKDVVGRTQKETFNHCPDFSENVCEKVLDTGEPLFDQQYQYLLRDGRKTYIVFNAYPFFYKDAIAGMYVIGRNMETMGEYIAKTLEIHKWITNQEDPKTTGANFCLSDIVGESNAITEAILTARKFARYNSPVMLIGETGTGKELFAQGIHNASTFAEGPFVPINCAAIPDTLLESVLFGTVRGAFTGAVDMPGLFEQAEGGTIFLDEINSMPFFLQAKLLRVLQDRVIRRIGGKKETPVNCRIISAANADPFSIDNDEILRSDLLYRLAKVTLYIPPLRERQGDVTFLARYFAKRASSKFGLVISEIADKLLELLESYHWPGNVRELENAIETAMHFVGSEESLLQFKHLPPHFKNRINGKPKTGYPELQTSNTTFSGTLLEIERRLIKDALLRNAGNISKTAKELNISRQNLHYKIKTYEI